MRLNPWHQRVPVFDRRERLNRHANNVCRATARAQQEQRERRAQDLREQEAARRQRELARRKRAIEQDIAILQEELREQEQEMKLLFPQDKAAEDFYQLERSTMSKRRGAD